MAFLSTIVKFCVKKPFEESNIYSVVHYISNDEEGIISFGKKLASFLDGIVINGDKFIRRNTFPETRFAQDEGDLFARIISFIKESPKKIGETYICNPNKEYNINNAIDYICTITVEESMEREEDQKITFRIVGKVGTIFSGSAEEFLEKYKDTDLEKELSLYNWFQREEKRKLVKLLKEKVDKLFEDSKKKDPISIPDIGAIRKEIVSIIDGIAFS